jgi:DNA repair exonuclease SbcCD nuclease subunit
MRICATGDIHIKLNQKNVPVQWYKDRFSMFVEQLQEMQKQADMLVIMGDIFDRANPTVEEVEVYFELISSCKVPTIAFAGNHEALTRNTTILSFLKKATNDLNPLVTIIDDYFSNEVFDIIPYNRLKDKEFPEPNNKILLTHVRGAIEPHVKPEIDLTRLDGWDVVLAADLHSYKNSQRNILYPGSPYTTSFHREEVKTGAILLDSETLKHEWLEFKLPQLIRKTIKAGETPVATDFHHTIFDVEGSLLELSSMRDSDLIDKKVSKRIVDSALILDPSLTLLDEVREYLLYIMQLPEEQVNKVLDELQQHNARIDL